VVVGPAVDVGAAFPVDTGVGGAGVAAAGGAAPGMAGDVLVTRGVATAPNASLTGVFVGPLAAVADPAGIGVSAPTEGEEVEGASTTAVGLGGRRAISGSLNSSTAAGCWTVSCGSPTEQLTMPPPSS